MKNGRPATQGVCPVCGTKIFKEERIHPKGTPFTEAEASDTMLISKFKRNASWLLPQYKIERAIECLFELENIGNVAEVIDQVKI